MTTWCDLMLCFVGVYRSCLAVVPACVCEMCIFVLSCAVYVSKFRLCTSFIGSVDLVQWEV